MRPPVLNTNNIAPPNIPNSIPTNITPNIPNSIPTNILNSNIPNSISTNSNIPNSFQDQMKNGINVLKNNIVQYRKIIGILVIVFLVLIVSYFISENYRINLVLNDMKIYDSYMTITNTDFSGKNDEEYRLSDYYIASSFRSITGRNQLLDYTSTRILEKILKEGARFIWFDIFNSDLSETPKPIVCNGIGKGNWNLSLNSIEFDEVCKVIASTAFTSGKVNNDTDPLFLGLNLNTQKNLHSLKKVKDSIIKHLGSRLMDVHYGFNKINFGDLPISKLKNKVVIFSSSGFEHSDLEEIINYSWDNKNLKNIVYKSIDPNIKVTEYVKENPDAIKDFNNHNLTIVTPDPNTLFTRQFEPKYSWELGCQFVCMYYQKVDKFVEQNIEKFKNNSFILKPAHLRSSAYKDPDIDAIQFKQDSLNGANENKLQKTFGSCPLISEDKNINEDLTIGNNVETDTETESDINEQSTTTTMLKVGEEPESTLL